MKKNYAFVFAAALALVAGYTAMQPSTVRAAAGETALSKCIDSVVAACNKKKSDDAISACFDNGASQCESEHKKKVHLPTPPRGQATTFKTNGQQQHPSRN